jgi:hypothetical protein
MPARIIKYTLEAFYSSSDIYGNCYWAFRFTCLETNKVVTGKISGGESNINAIRAHWDNPDGWDDSVSFSVTEMKIREFNRLTKNWTYAGCAPEELAKFIRDRLK